MDEIRIAEQVLVASLVLEPDGLQEVVHWLRPTDFEWPPGRLVFGRMVSLWREHRDFRESALPAALARHGELRKDGYPISEVLSWLVRVPVPTHPGRYGALVLTAALARDVVGCGTRLRQVCGHEQPARALAAVVAQRAALATAERRWLSVPEQFRTIPPAALELAGKDPHDSPASSSRPASCTAPEAGAEPALVELVTVGSLLRAPELTARVAAWLSPADFADPDAAVAFRQIVAMTVAGCPVDHVTLAARLRQDQPQPTNGDQWPGWLHAAQQHVAVPASVGFYARQVLDGAVLRQAQQVGVRLERIGTDQLGDARQLLDAAHEAVYGLRGVRGRWLQSRVPVPAPARPLVSTSMSTSLSVSASRSRASVLDLNRPASRPAAVRQTGLDRDAG